MGSAPVPIMATAKIDGTIPTLVMGSDNPDQQPSSNPEQQHRTLKRQREENEEVSNIDNESDTEEDLKTQVIQKYIKKAKHSALSSCKITVAKDKSKPVSKDHRRCIPS